MKKVFYILPLLLLLCSETNSQTLLNEGFETTDTMTVPAGWSRYNRATFYILPEWNWNVRDTGRSLPGLSSALSKAHTGRRACGITWLAGTDTMNGLFISNAWLVTKRISGIGNGYELSFWASGGSPAYTDSLQIWVSTVDSLPQNFTHYEGTIHWDAPVVYGEFTQYFYDLSAYMGQTIWVGFRYFQDCTVDGFFVHVDDVVIANPFGIEPISTEIPAKFSLEQNYPNPFNPSTNIKFSIAKAGYTKLEIFNELGQHVATPIAEDLKAGYYNYNFSGVNLPSGAYFYRLITNDFVKTNKMILIK